jgi:hypothetical protein
MVLVLTVALAVLNDPGVQWRIRTRRPAEQRGIALLRSWLTPEQALPRTVCKTRKRTYPKAVGFASLLVPSIFDAKFRPSRNAEYLSNAQLCHASSPKKCPLGSTKIRQPKGRRRGFGQSRPATFAMPVGQKYNLGPTTHHWVAAPGGNVASASIAVVAGGSGDSWGEYVDASTAENLSVPRPL